MTVINTEIGKVSWDGDLTAHSEITLPSGAKVKLQQWISLTNGECLEWLNNKRGMPRMAKLEQTCP